MTTQPHAVDPATIPDGTPVEAIWSGLPGNKSSAWSGLVYKDRDGFRESLGDVGHGAPVAWREGRIVAVLHRDGECPTPPEPEWITDPEEARKVVVPGALVECRLNGVVCRGVVGSILNEHVYADGGGWIGLFGSACRWRVLTPASDPDAEAIEALHKARNASTYTEGMLARLREQGFDVVRRDEEGQS